MVDDVKEGGEEAEEGRGDQREEATETMCEGNGWKQRAVHPKCTTIFESTVE